MQRRASPAAGHCARAPARVHRGRRGRRSTRSTRIRASCASSATARTSTREDAELAIGRVLRRYVEHPGSGRVARIASRRRPLHRLDLAQVRRRRRRTSRSATGSCSTRGDRDSPPSSPRAMLERGFDVLGLDAHHRRHASGQPRLAARAGQGRHARRRLGPLLRPGPSPVRDRSRRVGRDAAHRRAGAMSRSATGIVVDVAQRWRGLDHDRSREKAQRAFPLDARGACRSCRPARGRREHALHRRARRGRSLLRGGRRHRRSRRSSHAGADRGDDRRGDRCAGCDPPVRGSGRRIRERRCAGRRCRARGCMRHARRRGARAHRVRSRDAGDHAGVGRRHRLVPARRPVAGHADDGAQRADRRRAGAGLRARRCDRARWRGRRGLVGVPATASRALAGVLRAIKAQVAADEITRVSRAARRRAPAPRLDVDARRSLGRGRRAFSRAEYAVGIRYAGATAPLGRCFNRGSRRCARAFHFLAELLQVGAERIARGHHAYRPAVFDDRHVPESALRTS